jgi:hypothetical protein
MVIHGGFGPPDRIRLTGHPRIIIRGRIRREGNRGMTGKGWRNLDPHLLVLVAILALPMTVAVVGVLVFGGRALLRLVGML